MKKRKFIAAVMALSMIFGQTVYAQEYTVPEENLVESAEAVETEVSEETVESETEETAETAVELVELETEKVTAETEEMAAEYADSMMALKEGENAVEITDASGSVMVSFTPEESGRYFIYSTGDRDTAVELYDSDEGMINADDNSGDNTNFKLVDKFEANKTYSVFVRYVDDLGTGTMNVVVEKVTDKCGDNATWFLDEEGTLIISGEGAVTSKPWQGESIKKLVIEEGITDLGDVSFQYNSKLVSVELPSSLKVIPSYCFYNCTSLKEINIPKGVEKIEDSAFESCTSLKKAVIPASVIDIGPNYTFSDCAENFYILGVKGSVAEEYANENNIRFIDSENPVIPLEICDITLDQVVMEYDGSVKKPNVTVMDGDTELVEGKDYTIEYANNQNIGTATVTVKGNETTYTGEKTLEFQIVEVSDELTVGDNYVHVHINKDDGETSIFFSSRYRRIFILLKWIH